VEAERWCGGRGGGGRGAGVEARVVESEALTWRLRRWRRGRRPGRSSTAAGCRLGKGGGRLGRAVLLSLRVELLMAEDRHAVLIIGGGGSWSRGSSWAGATDGRRRSESVAARGSRGGLVWGYYVS
jgi:hypothetical protein